MVKKTGKVAQKPTKKQVSQQAVTAKKKPSASKKSVNIPQSRHLKSPRTKRFRLNLHRSAKIKHPVKLPKARDLTTTAWQTLWTQRRLFVEISLVYGVLNFILGRGFNTGVSITGLKLAYNQSVGGHPNPIASGIGTFGRLLGSSDRTATQASGPYQLFLLLMVSLAIIWVLRQVLAGVTVNLRDAYYRSMTPLVPFILVVLTIIVQLIPFSLGATLYSLILNNGIATVLSEHILFGGLFALLVIWTLYMLSSSLFALYIVTLPDMTPLKALHSAQEIVRHRRWVVLRKILWMPFVLFGLVALIMVPVIIIFAPAAQWIYLLLGMFVPAAAHAYMYTLYRELLREE
jgi:hypothetical protein